jgi:hypothetical protein
MHFSHVIDVVLIDLNRSRIDKLGQFFVCFVIIFAIVFPISFFVFRFIS